MKFDLDRLEIDRHLSLDRLTEITDIFIDRLRDDDWNEIPRSATIDRVALALAQHPQLSIELATKIFPFYPALVLTHPSLTDWLSIEPDSLDRWFWLYPDLFRYRDNLPDFFLQWAIEHNCFIVRTGAAESSQIPPLALDLLANDPEEYVVKAVAENTRTPSDTLLKLALDPTHGVRRFVAANPHTPITALAQLAADIDPRVRSMAATNPQLSTNL